MGGLYADQFVEVLAGGVDLAGSLCTGELRRIAVDRRQLRIKHVRNVHDERRLHRIFAIGERIQDLERAVSLAARSRLILRQARQITRVAPELGRDAVIWMPPNGEGEDDDTRSEAPNHFDDFLP